MVFKDFLLHLGKKLLTSNIFQLPSDDEMDKFYDAVDDFLAGRASESHMLGVHCTHGLNR